MAVMIMGSRGKYQVWFAGSWSPIMSKREAISHMAYIMLTKKEVKRG